MKTPKHKKSARKLVAQGIPSGRRCSNCGEMLMMRGGHFFPPYMGDEGFFVCATPKEEEVINKNFCELLA